MDNQQASLDAAWIAGLWLADGSFSLQATTEKNGRVRYVPRATLVCKDKPVVERAYTVLRENGVGAYIHKRTNRGDWADVYSLIVSNWKRMDSFMQWIEPYMVGRKRTIVKLLQFVSNPDQGGAGRLSDKDYEVRAWVHRAIKWLNRRGEEASETTPPTPPIWLKGEDIVHALREI